MIPLEILSGAFTVVHGVIILGQFVMKLTDVDHDTRTCIMLLERVNRDILAAEDLGKLVYPKERQPCRQQQRAVEVLRDTQGAAHDVTSLVCVPRHGRVPLRGRFQWVMGDKQAFLSREKRLNYCHQALVQVIATMESLMSRDLVSLSMPPAYNEAIFTGTQEKQSKTRTNSCSIRPSTAQRMPHPYNDNKRNSLDKWLSPSQKWVYLHSEGSTEPALVKGDDQNLPSRTPEEPSRKYANPLFVGGSAGLSLPSSLLELSSDLDTRLVARRQFTQKWGS
ncbi:hypothetical protein BGZ57DRAFT_933049 [Hyaloscypha finlandica]|nr:hypothetical protein BGZ57DRAFT_933049 [Hyaloscypha finlandica]